MDSYNFANMGEGKFNYDGTPRPGYIAKMFWAVVGSFLGFCFLLRICDTLLAYQRKQSLDARPRMVWTKLHATFTTIGRIFLYPSLPVFRRHSSFLYLPSVGRILFALTYMGLLLAFFFYKNPHSTSNEYENAGYRAAWLSITQLPLLVLLSSKRFTVITFLTGSSSSVSLNFFHRWVARGLLLTTTIHMYYMMKFYTSFQYLVAQLRYDPITRRGLGTWCVLAWIVVLTSVRPIRHYAFELFFANHVISVIAFFVVLMKHTPSYSHVYSWIAIGFFIADVALRWVFILLHNISSSGLKYRATITADNDLVVIDVPFESSRMSSWKPGQYMNLSFPTLAPFTSHPFTITSLPKDGKMQFIIRPKSGFTKRLQGLAAARSEEKQDDFLTRAVILDGPYGGPSRAWNQFDAVSNIVSGVGATYAFASMRDILRDSRTCNSVSMLWIVQKYEDVLPFKEQLMNTFRDSVAGNSETETSIQIFVADENVSPLAAELDSNLEMKIYSKKIEIISGKPDIRQSILQTLSKASGETAVAVCGSLSLAAQVKNDVAILLDARASHTGSGAQGCYVHVEQFQG
ncbi:FAD-binding domain-containing protein [Lipomyces arxii]|uniref:FAD-binding domain-containing protein n=1 Tax=Lipomyces arxii TaxID=56418 RepID=UPI0034CD7EEF